jgi:hypothetical protein
MWRIQYRYPGRNARVFTSAPLDLKAKRALEAGYREAVADGTLAWYRVISEAYYTKRRAHRAQVQRYRDAQV